MPLSAETRSFGDVWRFADCEFDALKYELHVAGQVADLERKPLDLIFYLLQKSGEVVRKEELLAAVWPGVLVVDANPGEYLKRSLDAQGHAGKTEAF